MWARHAQLPLENRRWHKQKCWSATQCVSCRLQSVFNGDAVCRLPRPGAALPELAEMRICGSWPSLLQREEKDCGPLAVRLRATFWVSSTGSDSAFGAASNACFNPVKAAADASRRGVGLACSWRYAMEAGIAIRSIKPLAAKSGLSVSRLLPRLGFREAAKSVGHVPCFQGFANGAGREWATPCSARRQQGHEPAEVIRSLCILHGLC